jgi:DNA-binding XRE family transcriptional regulator
MKEPVARKFSRKHISRPGVKSRTAGKKKERCAYGTRPPKSTDPRFARLGLRLRQLRQSRGLTQPQLAARAGCSLKHINNLELAVDHPTWGMLDQILTACKATYFEFYGYSAPGQEFSGQLLKTDLD